MALDGPTLRLLIEANTQGAQASMGQLAGVTDREMKKAVNAIKPLADAIRAQERAVAQAAQTMRRAANDEVEAAHRVAGGHAGVTRELLVLTHEMSQGNFSRFGGSMLVLAERIDLLGKLASPAGMAIGAVGAVVLGTAAYFIKGALEASEFAKQLQLTGNYAAVTAEAIERMSAAQAKRTGQSGHGAQQSLEAAAGSGLFGAESLTSAGRAMGDYEKLTGATAAEALKHFATMKDGVAKWAEAENESVHFLALSDYEHIKAMEKVGDAEGAMRLAMEKWADAVESRASPATRNFITQLKALQVQMSPDSYTGVSIDQFGMAALRTKMEQVNRDLFLNYEHSHVAAGSERDAGQGIKAADAIDSLLEKAKATEKYADAQKDLAAKFKTAAAAGHEYSEAEKAIAEAQLKKQYTPAAVAGANEYLRMSEGIKAYTLATADEIGATSKLSAAQQWAIQQHRALNEVTQGLTKTQRAALSADIDRAAGEREAADIEIASRKQAIAMIVEQTAREEEQQAKGEAFLATGEEKVAALIRQTAQIGLYGEALKEKQALDEIDTALMKANIGATAEQRAENERYAAQLRDHTVTALREGKKAQEEWNASFTNGAQVAFRQYAEAAKDNAALAEGFVTRSMQSMEDALTQFVMTGKLSFKSLADSIIADMVRIQIKKALASAGGVLNDAVNLFSSNSSWFGGYSGHANGLDYVPYDGYLASLHEGEKVVSKQDVRSTSTGMHFDFSGASYSFGAGVNPQQLSAAMQANNAAQEGRIRRLVATGALS